MPGLAAVMLLTSPSMPTSVTMTLQLLAAANTLLPAWPRAIAANMAGVTVRGYADTAGTALLMP